MHHCHPPAHIRRPSLRLRTWLPATCLGLALAACGGGGGGSDNAGGGDGGGSGVKPAPNSVFIAAAGPLCSRVHSGTGNCVQPTSSSVTEADLVKTITDPDARKPLIDFDAMGFIHNAVLSTSQQPGQPIASSLIYSSYGMQRRNVQVGRNSFAVEDRRYPDATSYPQAGQIQYKKPGFQGSVYFYIGKEEDQAEGSWNTSFTEGRNLSSVGTAPNVRNENTSWFSALYLLTDQAQAPREATVTYIAALNTLSGTSEKLDEHTLDHLSTAINYEAQLHTATGKLTGVKMDYTHPESQRRVTLELPELTFVNSRLDKTSQGLRTSVRAQGPGNDSREDAPRPDTARTMHDFTLDGLEGEITGDQAHIIRLLGAGPKGMMTVTLIRKDKLPADTPIHIPLPQSSRS